MALSILLVSIIISLVLGLYVISIGRRNATHILYFHLSMSMTTWITIHMLSSYVINEFVNLWLIRSSLFFALGMTVLFYLFADTIPRKKSKIISKKYWILYTVFTISSLVVLSPLTFSSVLIDGGEVIPQVGPGIVVFALTLLSVSIATIVLLVKKIKKAKDENIQKQFEYILFGFILMYVLQIATVLIPVVLFEYTFFVTISPLYTLMFLGMTGVAILKYKLFDVRIITTEILVSLIIVVLLFDAFNADSIWSVLLKVSIAVVTGFLGMGVVKSVKKEIAQRQELTKLAKRLERANVKLKELDEIKTEFLSIATHQLRTPLSIIKGYISLLDEGAYGEVNKEQRDIFNNIDISNERLVKLVDEFLNISRIEQGRTKYNFAPMSLTEVLESALEELRQKAKPKNIVLQSHFKSVPNIVGDASRLRHCVFNFIDNAIKYNDPRSKVDISIDSFKKGVRFRVTDNGPGLDEKDIKNLFQKFYRSSHVSRDFEGTGLGIFVVKEFVEAHGGHVWAKSDGIGKGSEFGFWLPLKPKKRRKRK